ncbi:ABC transporter ATP-binding protein [Wenzhouxiangella sp. XN79A]|uniref:ABC transporter ATP-binding protein n=1 Tax=Wenzhouxiangella sp. XN79A TaxID=2724193 RepID=UPI00144AB22F|nr:ABC transporter ATP-binding protein [Wenzhouxiangella sp. XN79A]NKI36424.1 ABC transporter ATP-binding protein [Wenzhouxiangella sp. XN79A]
MFSSEKSYTRLLRELAGHLPARRKKQLAMLLGLMFLGSMSEIITIGAVVPFISLMANPGMAMEYPLLQDLFGALGWHRPDSLVLPMSIVFVAIVAFATSIRLLLAYVSNKLVFAIGHDLGIRLYSVMLHQHYAYHISRNTSEVVGDINKVQIVLGTVLRPFMDGVIAIILGVAILVALLLVDAVTALSAGLLFVIIYLVVIRLFRTRLRRNSAVIATAQGSRVRAVQEGLGGIRDVILDGNQAHYTHTFSELDRGFRNAQAANAFLGQAPRFVVEAIGIALIVALAYTLSLQSGGLVAALPVLAALALAAQRLLPLVQQIYQAWAQFTGNVKVLEDVLESLALPVDESLVEKSTHLAFSESIELDDVGFRYAPDQPEILQNISLKIPKGSRVGIVGQTGGGKSTLMDVVMGLLEPTAGQIRVDRVSVHRGNRRDWQRRIAHVPQHIYLSDATIAENIALGVHPDDIDQDRVRSAARQAQIADFIESGRNGYETRVGERGVQLSGGQRQRIAIARALYKSADVLVFDEASSALDADTETAVMEAVDNLDPDLTLFIIAHRVQTLRKCNLIIRLEEGRLASVGTYEDVIGAEAAGAVADVQT